jgi:polysaccharide export outer membrane protein
MGKIKIGWVFTLTLLLLAGCATSRPVGLSPDIQLTDLTALPSPSVFEQATLQPFDQLEIRIVGAENFDGSYMVDENGRLYFPYVGSIQAAGLSPGQVRESIVSGLEGKFIVNPQVVVELAEGLRPSISVGGEVKKPGSFDARTSQSLMRAINNAGGLEEFAKSDDVLLFRTVEGQRYIGVFNMAAIKRGNYPDPRVFAGDVVMVGDSPSKRLIQTVIEGLGVLATLAILIDRTTN